MQSSPLKKKKRDLKPILFSSSTSKKSGLEDGKSINPQSGFVPVHIKFVEINLTKVRTKLELYGQIKPLNELSSKKRDHMFIVPKDDIQRSKFLKSNYLPEDNVIEVPVPVNINIPYPSFEVLQKLMEAIVEKEKTESATYPLEVTTKNSIELFAGACLMELEDLAMSIYEASIKQRMSLKLLVGLLLIGLEYNLPKAFIEFYKIFREYWIFKNDWTTDCSPMVQKIIEGKDDGTNLVFEHDMFCVYYKDRLEFGFPPAALKRPFEMFRKDLFKDYFKPEQKYFVMNVRRKRTVQDIDGVLESSYPHKYYFVNVHTNEVVAYAIRNTEYGDFYLYGDDDTNEMMYGSNYIGQIEANTWGTSFDVYDDGIYEAAFHGLPPNICALRTKIANITYETNLMGETPRQMKVEFIDYAEKKASQLAPQEPKYDEKNDCYTLNFYGKAKVASARNFILTFPKDQDNVIMMQGKASKDIFNLDYRHPLNIVQAFSISLISIGKKFCVS